MSEISRKLQELFRTLREFWNRTGFLTPESDDKLSLLHTVQKDLEKIAAREQTRADEEETVVRTLKTTCEKLIFGNYLPVTNKIAALANTIQEISELESEIQVPKEMQPKVSEVKGYVAKVKTEIVMIDNAVSRMIEKINRAIENDFKMSQTEIKELKREEIRVDFGLKTCEEYCKVTERVLNDLKSEVTNKLITLLGLAALGFVGMYVTVGGRLAVSAFAVPTIAVTLEAWIRRIRNAGIAGSEDGAAVGTRTSEAGVQRERPMFDSVWKHVFSVGGGYACYQLMPMLAKHLALMSEVEGMNSKLEQTKLLYSQT